MHVESIRLEPIQKKSIQNESETARTMTPSTISILTGDADATDTDSPEEKPRALPGNTFQTMSASISISS